MMALLALASRDVILGDHDSITVGWITPSVLADQTALAASHDLLRKTLLRHHNDHRPNRIEVADVAFADFTPAELLEVATVHAFTSCGASGCASIREHLRFPDAGLTVAYYKADS